jgi:hypothetical protein
VSPDGSVAGADLRGRLNERTTECQELGCGSKRQPPDRDPASRERLSQEPTGPTVDGLPC